MKLQLSTLTFFSLFTIISEVHGQVSPDIQWQKCLGGTNNEAAFSIQQIAGGGFIVAGYSDSNDGDVSGNHGQQDYWVMELDAASNLTWQKSLGGNSIDYANSVKQTTDGGFIVAGYSYSNNGDVTGNHGTDDYWIVKLDADGSIEWQKCFGGTGDDGANSIQQTSDDGYIIAGWSSSNDGDVSGNHGLWDYWIVKLDMEGSLVWQKSFGGSQNDMAYAAKETADGGYIIAGYSESSDGDVSGNHGLRDYWIVKCDADGNLVWETFAGGSAYDEAYAVQETSGGEFIICGFAGSTDGDVSGNHGGYDYWIVKLDTAGNLISTSCYGGTNTDQSFTLQLTTDGGYIAAGQSASNNGDVSGNHGGYDFWIIKLDSDANLEWQKSLGGSNDEYGPYSIQQTTDGGFAVSGASLSNDQDVSGNHGGSFYGDCWVVKLGGGKPTGISSPTSNFISLYPNPAQNQLNIDLHSFGEGGINSTSPANDLAIRVYDLEGKIMVLPETFKVASSGQNTQLHLDIASLADGFYTLQIINSKTGEIEIEKFVK